MVYRIHSSDGIRLPKPFFDDAQRWIVDYIVHHRDRIETCDPGTYNLTPTWWTKHNYNWVLHVAMTGAGILRAIPRYADSAFQQILQDGSRDVVCSGMKNFPLGGKCNGGNPISIIGPLRDRRNLGAYEIIFYLPETMPISEKSFNTKPWYGEG